MPPPTYSTVVNGTSHSIPLFVSPTPLVPTITPIPSPALTVSQPPTQTTNKRRRLEYTSKVPADIGEFQSRIAKDAKLLQKIGWKKFVKIKRPVDDFGNLQNLNHHARRLLRQYKHTGAPVILHTNKWTNSQINQAIDRGPHKSCEEHIDFLEEEFTDMLNKGQWVVLPYDLAVTLPNLRISPPGVVPQRNRRPRWICDYTWSKVNQETVPIAPINAMQFGHALDRILREILIANPNFGDVKLIKLDISDGFYRVGLKVDDIPKLGVAFPSRPHQEKLVALPLVLPMGWKNSPPIFSAATETSADLANRNLAKNIPAKPHHLDDAADLISLELANNSPTIPTPTSHTDSTSLRPALPANTTRDPSLPFPPSNAAYVDVFVDDFIALCQGSNAQERQVRRTLLHAVDTIFRPLSPTDSPYRREPVSLKKLREGDCTWSTQKLILGWIIDTTAKTIHLPPHRIERLNDILSSIPPSQKRISEKRWHKILGELRSMSLALPGAKHLFSQMQLALSTKSKRRITLKKGVHQAVIDFKAIAADIASRPTRIAELVPVNPSLLGDHDASGQGAGGVWFPSASVTCRNTDTSQPILWRAPWPEDIVNNLVSDDNPTGTINNSDLELAGGLLQLDAATQNFDVRERTILSRTDNLATLFWQCKGSVSSNKAHAYLLRLFGMHQRYHRYVPRHDYLPGKSNKMANDSSRLFSLTDNDFLAHFNRNYPQTKSFKLWTPSSQMLSAVISALRKKTSNPASVQIEPPPPTLTGTSGSNTSANWPWIPSSKPSRTKYPCFKSSADEFVLENYRPANVPSSLDRLKSTYGRLDRRSSQWGSLTLA